MELSLPLRPPALAVPRVPRLPARALVCLALALPPSGGGWLWLRGSPLVAISHVHIAGVRAGPEAMAVRVALDRAAEGMTTLHFDVARLRTAVADYPIVASVRAHTSFPHGLSIEIGERAPVAVLAGPGVRTAVAADGTVLGPALVSASLPSVAVKRTPATGARVHEALALAAATVLGATSPQLLHDVARAYEGDEGLTLQMHNGLLVYFGDATLPHAKWLSLARVLSSPTSAGAVYINVSLPSRPAAGFALGAAADHTVATAAASQIGVADPTAATLAERLTQAVGGGSGTAATGTTATTGSTGESGETGAGGAGAAASPPSEQSEVEGAGAAAGASSEAGATSGSPSAVASQSEQGSPAGAAGGTQAP